MQFKKGDWIRHEKSGYINLTIGGLYLVREVSASSFIYLESDWKNYYHWYDPQHFCLASELEIITLNLRKEYA